MERIKYMSLSILFFGLFMFGFFGLDRLVEGKWDLLNPYTIWTSVIGYLIFSSWDYSSYMIHKNILIVATKDLSDAVEEMEKEKGWK